MKISRAPAAARGVQTLMHVGNADGLGASEADTHRIAKKAAWVGLGLWGAGLLSGHGGMRDTGFWVGVSGLLTSWVTR